MRNRAPNRIEVIANISIIFAAALGGFVLARDHIFVNRVRTELRDMGVRTDAKREALVGRPVTLPDVDWAQNGQTLLVVLSNECHFCTESAPFYNKMILTAAERKDLRVIAVFPQAVDEAKAYLAQIQVPISDVRQISFYSIGVRGTPSLVLVDKAGLIKDAWLGRLRPDKEAEVLQRISCQECG